MVERYTGKAEIVGFCDINLSRAAYVREQVSSTAPIYQDFDAMIKETRPDAVIVTTVDRFHAEYIIRSMEYGCDVITEKPMCINAEQVKSILEAEKRTGKKLTVTFNYRFVPYATRIKELLRQKVIGDILHVDFEYMLDRNHGAEYYRRWHRQKENSGGLLVHKSTHHFDLINWWLEQTPELVYADGSQRFYGQAGPFRGSRCSDCEHIHRCDFAFKHHEDPFLQSMYFQAEKEDGYIRDGCVFAEEIDLEDSMSVVVKYAEGAQLSYSLVTYSPYEGWRASFTGTKGRLEAAEYHTGPEAGKPYQSLQIFAENGDYSTVNVKFSEGGHGGGDERLQDTVFAGPIADPLGHQAGSLEGARSVLIGICANQTICERKPVLLTDYLSK